MEDTGIDFSFFLTSVPMHFSLCVEKNRSLLMPKFKKKEKHSFLCLFRNEHKKVPLFLKYEIRPPWPRVNKCQSSKTFSTLENLLSIAAN